MGFTVDTFYANSEPQMVVLSLELSPRGWCELQKRPEFRRLEEYLDRSETQDSAPKTPQVEVKAQKKPQVEGLEIKDEISIDSELHPYMLRVDVDLARFLAKTGISMALLSLILSAISLIVR